MRTREEPLVFRFTDAFGAAARGLVAGILFVARTLCIIVGVAWGLATGGLLLYIGMSLLGLIVDSSDTAIASVTDSAGGAVGAWVVLTLLSMPFLVLADLLPDN
jgi:hypothetical protein